MLVEGKRSHPPPYKQEVSEYFQRLLSWSMAEPRFTARCDSACHAIVSDTRIYGVRDMGWRLQRTQKWFLRPKLYRGLIIHQVPRGVKAWPFFTGCVCANTRICIYEVEVSVAQSRPTFCDPKDCSPPGSSVRGILQARLLEWVAISYSRGSSWPRD